MIQDMAIVMTADEYELVVIYRMFPFPMIFSDPLVYISRSRYFSTSNNLKMVWSYTENGRLKGRP